MLKQRKMVRRVYVQNVGSMAEHQILIVQWMQLERSVWQISQ